MVLRIEGGVGLKNGVGVGEGRFRGRHLLALVFATLLAFGVAVPVFAQEEPANEDGGGFQPQVVGGEPVPDGSYEFVAAVRDITRGNTAREQHFCGGTLLDDDSVLTAAHCLERVNTAQLRVTLGRADLSSNDGQTRSVTAILRHPRYTNSIISFRYDAAVLQLSAPINNIKTVTIPRARDDSFEDPNDMASVAGWGNTEKQSPSFNQPDRFPNRMQRARVPLVSDDRAKRVYDRSYAKPLMVAAGREGKDTCQGDSGGPLFKGTNGDVYQIGITSFGNGCGSRGFPGVYAETNSPDIRNFITTSAASN